MQQAMVAALKASHQPIPPPLYVVLGYSIRDPKPVTITSSETIWRPGMATLYLVEQGTTLRKEQERFLVQTATTTEIPIREVEQILVFGSIQLTTSVIATCLEQAIPVIFLSQLGDYKGHLWSSDRPNLAIEAAQFDQRHNASLRLAIARAIVVGKLQNSRHLLLRLNRKRQHPDVAAAIQSIQQDLDHASDPSIATDHNILMGYEGSAAQRYFTALGTLITNPGFSLTQRTRRPPKDPVNSLLSFGYTLLLNNVLSLLLAAGFHPYLGNLHGSDRHEAFLAFDLMEEFRSPIVDTLVIKLINQKILKPTDFTWPQPDGGIYLTDPARRVFLRHFEERISFKITHPDIQDLVSYRRVIQLQIQRYKHCLFNGTPYQPFRRID
jgi:CRISPR-associated protein Cas1